MDLAEAARRTLRTGSARLDCHRYVEPARLPESWSRGTADFPAHRTHVEVSAGDYRTEEVFAGTAQFSGPGLRWDTEEEGDPWAAERAPSDPAWIIERLARATNTSGLVFTLHDEAPHVTGEAWVDGGGLMTRVLWTHTHPFRPRAPWPWFFKARYWNDLQLSEHGLAVAIPVPDANPPFEPSNWQSALIGVPVALFTLYGRRAARR